MSGDGRLLGLDLGNRRIGAAISDSARTVATGLKTLERTGDRGRDHRAIADLVAEYEAVGIVVGVPYSMSGAVGTAATAALEEVQSLRSVVDVEVVTVDERLTTVAAHGALRRGGQSSRARKSIVDQTAAAVILQSWLDRAGAAR